MSDSRLRPRSASAIRRPRSRPGATELSQQQSIVDTTRRALQQNLDALALRLGQMNAHVVRLDALGARLTQMAGLKDGEFDFTTAPSLGGPEEPIADTEFTKISGVVSALDVLDSQLADRSRQLGVLEDLLLNRKLHDEVHPEGRPVTQGYISSRFGSRTDPFTGRRAFHKGVDFAGREGAEVVAVASGVVIWSGQRYGYGQLVEVNHGNGYVTRYAHNARQSRRGRRHGAAWPGHRAHGRHGPCDRAEPPLRGPAQRRAGRSSHLHRPLTAAAVRRAPRQFPANINPA